MYANEAIAGAMEAMEADIPEAEAETTRPIYHFRPPAGYHNDPNGLIWHDGSYHMFYQHHPFTHGRGKGGPIFWGHARSGDLLHWEHLPMAIWPSTELGEDRCASGSTVINPAGEPMIFYTCFGDPSRGRHPREAPDQWAALGDKDLIVWRKHPANPVLTGAVHGGLPVLQWRDPFVFLHEGTYYMLLGGKVDRGGGFRGGILIYRARNDALTDWEFLNVLLEWPDPAIESLECPNIFRFDDKWLLFLSYHPPATRTAYLVGALDTETFTFQAERQGSMDLGTMGVYAPQAMRDGQGRVIGFGWIRPAGWHPGGGHGWSGCMTLPRVLSLDADGSLRQEPAEELRSLRGRHRWWRDLTLDDAGCVLDGVSGDALEILADFAPSTQGACGLKVRRAADGSRAVLIRHDGRQLHVTGADPEGLFAADEGISAGMDYHVPLPRADNASPLRLHVFIDKCVLEIYVDGGACITRAIYSPAGDLGVEVFAEGGRTSVRSLDVWEISSIW